MTSGNEKRWCRLTVFLGIPELRHPKFEIGPVTVPTLADEESEPRGRVPLPCAVERSGHFKSDIEECMFCELSIRV